MSERDAYPLISEQVTWRTYLNRLARFLSGAGYGAGIVFAHYGNEAGWTWGLAIGLLFTGIAIDPRLDEKPRRNAAP